MVKKASIVLRGPRVVPRNVSEIETTCTATGLIVLILGPTWRLATPQDVGLTDIEAVSRAACLASTGGARTVGLVLLLVNAIAGPLLSAI